MNEDRYNILLKIYNGLLDDQKVENKKVQNNLNRIQEIDVYLKSIKEDSDLAVFSPRSAENIFSDKLKELEDEKYALENNNKSYYHKLNELNIQINQLEQLLKDDFDKVDNRKSNDYCNTLDILDIQEKERQRIARELHDSSVQNLTHLVHMIELSSMFIDGDPIRAKLELENCIKILKSSIDEIRGTIFNLRPMSFDDLGFKQCIEDFITNSQIQYNNCKIDYDICELTDDDWQNKDKHEVNLFMVTIYRVIQEALINALKHSNADKINLVVKMLDRKCFINIKDNGNGFSLENVMKQSNKHFGLFIMKERISLLHGNILINTEIGKGTEIKIEIPLV